MEICNDKILEMLVHTVTINRYVDEEQVSQLVACAEKYGFSRQAIMGKLNEDDESSETQVFSDCFAEETEQVRQAILSDMVKLACFDGAFDDAEMEFINKVSNVSRKAYEQSITEGLREFSTRVYDKPVYKRIFSMLRAFFCKLIGMQREFYTLEQIAQQYRKGLYKIDCSEKIIELLEPTSGYIEHSTLQCKYKIQNQIASIVSQISELKAQSHEITIALIGETMAGKSTLFNILVGSEHGEFIGHGKQRTTRFVRVGHWHGIRLLDTPGLNAQADGGRDDEALTLEAAKQADIFLVVVTSDTQDQNIKKFFRQFELSGKPIYYVVNVKNNPIKSEKSLRALIEAPQSWTQTERYEGYLDNIEKTYKNSKLNRMLKNRYNLISCREAIVPRDLTLWIRKEDLPRWKKTRLTRHEQAKLKNGSGVLQFQKDFCRFVAESIRFAPWNRYFDFTCDTMENITVDIRKEVFLQQVVLQKLKRENKERQNFIRDCGNSCKEEYLDYIHKVLPSSEDLREKVLGADISRETFEYRILSICHEYEAAVQNKLSSIMRDANLQVRNVAGISAYQMDCAFSCCSNEPLDFSTITWKTYGKHYGKRFLSFLGLGSQTLANIDAEKKSEVIDNAEIIICQKFQRFYEAIPMIDGYFADVEERAMAQSLEKEREKEKELEDMKNVLESISETKDNIYKTRVIGFLSVIRPKATYHHHTYDADTLNIYATHTHDTDYIYSGSTIKIRGVKND